MTKSKQIHSSWPITIVMIVFLYVFRPCFIAWWIDDNLSVLCVVFVLNELQCIANRFLNQQEIEQRFAKEKSEIIGQRTAKIRDKMQMKMHKKKRFYKKREIDWPPLYKTKNVQYSSKRCRDFSYLRKEKPPNNVKRTNESNQNGQWKRATTNKMKNYRMKLGSIKHIKFKE